MHHTFRSFAILVGLQAILLSGCSGTDESESDLGEVASPVVFGNPATQDQIYSAVALVTQDGKPLSVAERSSPRPWS